MSEELETDHDTLVYLYRHGFVPGAAGIVRTVAPDQTRLIVLEGTTVAVGISLASNLFVTLTSP